MNYPPTVLSSLADMGGSGIQRVLWPLLTCDITGYIYAKMPPQMIFLDLETVKKLKPDTIMFQRSHTEDQYKYISMIKSKTDCLLVYTIDDWLGATPKYSPHYQEIKPYINNIDKEIRKTVKLCDRFIVTNDLLADVYGQGKDCYVIPSYLPRFIWEGVYQEVTRPQLDPTRKPRIGYSGGIGHPGDVELLKEVADALGDEVQWVFQGMHPEWAKGKSNVQLVPGCMAQDHPRELYKLDLDIALAPLVDNQFNRAKSCCKVLEYAACSYFTLASDIKPYKDMPVPLLPLDPQVWIEEIRNRIKNIEETRQQGKELHDWVWKEYKMEDHANEYAKVFSRDKLPFVPDIGNSNVSSTIDIVITAYNNLKVIKPCIESILGSQNQTPYEIVIVDDGSTNQDLHDYLNSLELDPKFHIHRLKKNIGYLSASNIGFLSHPDRDVISLNSDTIVHGDWIDRMKKDAYSGRYATATPFSNAASLMTYPTIQESKLVPSQVPILDDLLKETNLPIIPIPTSHGFCQFMRREVMREIGLLDENAYGRGYCEENDWGMRAMKRGWLHASASDVYVGHEGSATFGAEKAKLIQDHSEILNIRWPSYFRNLQEWNKNPVINYLKIQLDLNRMAQSKDRVLVVTHRLGGGIESRINGLLDSLFKGAVFMKYHPQQPHAVSFESPTEDLHYLPVVDTRTGLDPLVTIIQQMGISKISIQTFVGWENHTPEWFSLLLERLGLPFEIYLHDYYMICPRVKMVNQDLEWCGDPMDVEVCNKCVLSNGSFAGLVNMSEWREMYHTFLRKAQKIIAPSEHVKSIYLKYYPDLDISYIDHNDDLTLTPVSVPYKEGDTVNVAIFGDISVEKGAKILEECVEYVATNNLPVKFIHAGSCSVNLTRYPNVITTLGSYKKNELPNKLKQYNCHVSFFPNQWGETYSHSLSESFKMCLYPVAIDIGAVGERIRRYGYGTLLPYEERHNTKLLVDTLIQTAKEKGGLKFEVTQ